MKTKIFVLSCLVILVFLSMSHELSFGVSKSEAVVAKVGVVDIRLIFEKCNRNEDYRKEAAAEQERIVKELKKLRAEIEAEDAALQTLKPESKDYMARAIEVLAKRSRYQPQQELYKQQLELKDKTWTETLFKDILRITGIVAKDKGLNLVLENDQLELPTASFNDLMLTIRTHKVLYSDSSLDISEDVLALLDAEK